MLFFLKTYKNDSNRKEIQDLYDFVFKQIELSIREIGYGDASVNKKMKSYVNTLYSIIDKVELWNSIKLKEKLEFFSNLIDTEKEADFYIDYFNKYSFYLSNNSFNYFTKEVISHKF